MSEKFIKSLSGHSGCEIYLMNNDNGFFIRKTAGNPNYNDRLQIQISKQIAYKSTGNARIYAPKIYKTGMIDDIFYVDMEYIDSCTMANSIEQIMTKGISPFIDLVVRELYINNSVILPETNQIFQKKILSLRKNIPQKEIYINALERLNKFDFSDVPHSKCHGDLTLENILVDTKGNIYLIDFLDSFFDSWMIDVAKLLQDLELYWSYRHTDISANLTLRLSIAKETLIKHISQLPNGNKMVVQIYYILLLNIMRIVPYTKDIITEQFLEKAISKLNTIIDTKEQLL